MAQPSVLRSNSHGEKRPASPARLATLSDWLWPLLLHHPAPGMVFVVNTVLAWLMFSIDVRNAMLR